MPRVLAKYPPTVLTTSSCLTQHPQPWNSGQEPARANAERKRKWSFFCYLHSLGAGWQIQTKSRQEGKAHRALTDARGRQKVIPLQAEKFSAFQATRKLCWAGTTQPCPVLPHTWENHFTSLLFLGYSWVSCAWSCEQIEFPQVGKALRMSLNIQIFLLFSQQQLLSSFVSAQGFSRNAGE